MLLAVYGSRMHQPHGFFLSGAWDAARTTWVGLVCGCLGNLSRCHRTGNNRRDCRHRLALAGRSKEMPDGALGV